MKLKKVYAVNSGSYSDYHIDAVFSTKEKADEFMRVFPKTSYYDSYNDIEVWDVDGTNNLVRDVKSGYREYSILMQRDGTIESIFSDPMRHFIEARSFLWKRTASPFFKGSGKPDVLNCDVWAKNEKHAIKIANEIRTRMIADGEWK